MRANQRVTKEELKSVPPPRRITLTNFAGEKIEMIFYANKECFASDMLKFKVGDKVTYVLRDEILRYLDNLYIKGKEPDMYSEEDLADMERQAYIKPLNPKFH